MAEIITRKWKGGQVVSEERTQIDWGPNEADLDTEKLLCTCGMEHEIPFDACFALDQMTCGGCGVAGNIGRGSE